MDRKLWYLKGCDLFEKLTPEQADRLDRSALVRTYKRKSLIYSPTEIGQTVMLLATGRVKIKDITPDGKETILAFIEEGEIFGELALVDADLRQEYAEAVIDSEVLAIPREEFLWLMSLQPDVALSITKLISFRRRRIENRLRNVLFLPSRDRMVRLLLELVEAHGNHSGNQATIRLPLSNQELASLIGVTRETVNAVLGRLRQQGLVKVERRQITILDMERLRRESNMPIQPVVARSRTKSS